LGELVHKSGHAADQMMMPPLEDRRLVSRVLRHVTKGAVDHLPRLNDVDPWLVGDDWSYCALTRVRQPPEQSVFIVVGDNLLPTRGMILDREPISHCPPATLLGVALSFLAPAVEERALLMVEGSALHLGASILYRSLLVPLSEDDRHIEAVLIAANFREVREGEDTRGATRLVWSHSFGSKGR
jgi:hypothetical protein